jgi:uncharacterized protein YggT (Ycf19 family)
VDLVGIIVLVLQLYFYAVLAWVVLSWIPVSPGHPLGRVSLFLDRLVFPVILPLRRIIPPLRLGGGMLDLSPIVLLIGVRILISVVARIG